MKIKAPLMIQDPSTGKYENRDELVENVHIVNDHFIDGPVTSRLAVLDFSPEDDKLVKGAPFIPPPKGRVLGKYQFEETDVFAPEFMQVSVFTTIMKTIDMFEKRESLGRPLSWAFPAEQLLVVPRAGKMANAYYERESNSLQFFYFPHPNDPEQNVYTCLSRDIVVHETGHAILDGIAPFLFDAITPQALAMHEAIADLTALLMAFGSKKLGHMVLKETDGSIENATAFSSIAEQFGDALKKNGHPLRELNNSKSLDPAAPDDDRVDRREPHSLSEVLSGALYQVMRHIFKRRQDKIVKEKGKTPYQASFPALYEAAEEFKRLVFRALDYLPPGEVSFADYGRAIIATGFTASSSDKKIRDWVTEEFVKRKMVMNPKALSVRRQFKKQNEALKEIDLDTLVHSDWAAYDFANNNRELLYIPKGIPFEVHRRLGVTKKNNDNDREYRECIFKVSWTFEEFNGIRGGFPQTRRIPMGTTLVVDWASRKVLSLLTTNHEQRRRQDELEEQREDREQMLRKLSEEGTLRLEDRALGVDGKPLISVVKGEIQNQSLRIRGAARMLHISGEHHG